MKIQHLREQWMKFCSGCFSNHVDQLSFRGLVETMDREYPLNELEIVKIFLQPPIIFSDIPNPFISYYVEELVDTGIVSLRTVLTVLLQNSSIYHSSLPVDPNIRGAPRNCITLDDFVFDRLVIATTKEKRLSSIEEVLGVLRATAKWMRAIVKWEATTGVLHNDDQSSELWGPGVAASQFLESFNYFLCALSIKERVSEIIAQNCPIVIKQDLESALSEFMPFLSTIPVANLMTTLEKLDVLQKSVLGSKPQSLEALEEAGELLDGVDAMQFESEVVDVSPENTRAGLFVYLNALLVGVPIIDDNLLLGYLNARYQGNVMTLATDLITASFDVASNAMSLNESNQKMQLLRSYLVNKLPVLLTLINQSSFNTLPAESCLTQALGRLDPNAFPSFSQTFGRSNSNDILADVRQDFLFACALHGLIPEQSIEQLLGEVPMSTLPTGGRYVKENLVQQCVSHSEHIERLITELDRMEGNAGAIANALTEIIQNLCSDTNTIGLKSICVSLAKRPQSLDVICLFNPPIQILQPITHLLDRWNFNSEGGESQPVYDEFGSILLLVLMFKHRYGLSAHDLGIDSADSWLGTFLERGSNSQFLQNLTEEQQKHIGGWISGLFIAEGINDELMSQCKPHDFYLLIPTLFSQCLSACEAGKIDMETLKGGFEYLLEPFLLPSLIPALTWLSTHLRTINTVHALDISMQALAALIEPRSISGEAHTMHTSILSITATPLFRSLHFLQKHHPSRSDIPPLIEVLKPYSSFSRKPVANIGDLANWCRSTQGGNRHVGLLQYFEATLKALLGWSTSNGSTNTPHGPRPQHHQQPPPHYPPALLSILHIFSPISEILNTIIIFLITYATNANTTLPLAIDLAASIILAPQTLPSSHPANINLKNPATSHSQTLLPPTPTPLQDALTLEYESTTSRPPKPSSTLPPNNTATPTATPHSDQSQSHHKTTDSIPRLLAEATIRLHRRVSALAATASHVRHASAADPNVMDVDHAAAAAAADVGLGVGVGLGPSGEDDLMQGIEGVGLGDSGLGLGLGGGLGESGDEFGGFEGLF
ncbi:MAG: mediator complex subunit [Cirrosporium novae-zelandiae]|nr:MAG: mediator complex subunit [Cirrosporium novae-zelandiae]